MKLLLLKKSLLNRFCNFKNNYDYTMEIKPPFLNLSRDEQKIAVEVLLFSSEEPLSLKLIFDLMITKSVSFPNIFAEDENHDNENGKQLSLAEEIMKRFDVSPDYFNELIDEINKDLADTMRPYEIINIADGYQLATRPEYGRLLQSIIKVKQKRKFSQASLESLSIIAYKQPVSKPEIEQIRGVNSNEIVNSLLEKKLIRIVGRKEALGKPLLYGTTNYFLKVFGLVSLEHLPKLREIEEISSSEIPNSENSEMTFDLSDSEDIDNLDSNSSDATNLIKNEYSNNSLKDGFIITKEEAEHYFKN